MQVKVKGYINDTLGEFFMEQTEQEQEQTELSDEMKQAIENFIVDFLTEGDTNDNGTD